MNSNLKKFFVYIILAVSLILPILGVFGSVKVYADTNTKSGTAADMVAVAKAQKNGSDGWKYIKWLWKSDKKYRQWCAAFVSWCANQAGAGDIIEKNGGCENLYKDVISAGGKVVTTPKPGDLIFYHKNGAAKTKYCHVGIVVKVNKKSVETVQGNVAKKVWNTLKATSYQLEDETKNYTIVYVRPNYNEVEVDNISESNSTTSSTTKTTSTSKTITNLGGATVNIINKASGKALDVSGSNTSSSNKSNVDITTLVATNKSSQFKFTKTSGGWYTISPVSNSKLAVNPYSNKPKNGTNVNVYTKDASDKTQGWIVKQIGDDYVILSAYNKSLALTAAGTGDNSNVKIATYSEGNTKQLWSFVLPSGQNWGATETDVNNKEEDKKVEDTTKNDKVEDTNTTVKDNNNDKENASNEDAISIVSGTKYYITNKASGKALDVYGDVSSSTNKSNVQIYKLNKSSKCSQFKVIETSGGWYSIVPMSNTKLAVNPYSDKPSNGTNVNVYTKDASDKTQGWIFEKSGDYYIIRSAYKNSLVLTATGTSNSSNVEIATYSKGNNNQLWKLTEV